MKKTFREKIQFYLIDCKTPLGKFIDIVIIALNLLILAVFVAETYLLPERIRSALNSFETIIVILFIIEYLARLYGAKNRLKHIFNIYSIIDLIAILPILSLFLPLNISFIRIIRVFRVFRIFRFFRFTADPYFFFGNISVHVLKVVRLVLTILMIFFVSSGFFWYIESPINPNIVTFGDAFYFTVGTLATVGFGDIVPVSESGRWITILMILSGIIFIPWQASQIIKEWLFISEKKEAACPKCGLKYHDKDATHCKACGYIIYQEHDSN